MLATQSPYAGLAVSRNLGLCSSTSGSSHTWIFTFLLVCRVYQHQHAKQSIRSTLPILTFYCPILRLYSVSTLPHLDAIQPYTYHHLHTPHPEHPHPLHSPLTFPSPTTISRKHPRYLPPMPSYTVEKTKTQLTVKSDMPPHSPIH